MRSKALGLIAIVASVAVLGAQSKLPSDIHPESFSRLPPVLRDGLDAEGKRVWDLIGGGRGMPKTGPAPVSMYSPGAARPPAVPAISSCQRSSRRVSSISSTSGRGMSPPRCVLASSNP